MIKKDKVSIKDQVNELAIKMINRIQAKFGPRFDRFFVDLKYQLVFKKRLNWKNPKTFNEKLCVSKISPEAEKMWIYADKLKVREYVAKKVGTKILNKLYGVYRTPEEIDLASLPNQFILKTTHASGWNIVCQNKSKLNWKEAKEKLNRWLKTSYYQKHKERYYKLVKPRIICEKYLENEDGQLTDYKFFCFAGKPKFIHVDVDRLTNHQRDFYDLSWRKLPVWQGVTQIERIIPKPSRLATMIKLAKQLSIGFPHVRIDFYQVKNKIYFSEVTFAQYGGLKHFHPDKYDYIFGSYFKLRP
jgi:hypothetical protein